MEILPGAIAGQFERLERKKNELMHLIRSVPSENYTNQSDNRRWSVGQAANHLYLSEKLSLAYLRKKVKYATGIPPFSWKSKLSMMTYKLIFKFKKAKAPAQINMWDQQEVLLPDELDKRWDDLREEIKVFVSDQYPVYKNALIFKHPFAGRLSMYQMLVFFGDHIAHHTKQINRIIKNIQ